MFRCFWKNAAAGAMVLMIIVMQGCSSRSTEESRGNDSLFLNQAYAKTDSSLKESANEDAYESRHTAITRAAALAGPAVVGINVMQVKRYVRRSPFYTEDPVWRSIFPELFRDQVYEKPIQNLGSGFIISSDGYIVTNDHVVTDGKEIVVTLSGGERHNAKLVGTDRISDISLLKIDGQDLPYLQMGNSKEKRTDCRLLTLALVLDEDGFPKASKVLAGNTPEPSTLEGFLRAYKDDLRQRLPLFRELPTVVVDAGIGTKDNLDLIRGEGFSYITVRRSRSSEMPEGELRVINERKEATIEAMKLEGDGGEVILYCRSSGRLQKEASIKSRLQKHYEEGLEHIAASIGKKRGAKRYEKVLERLGRLRERYPTIARFYRVEVSHEGQKATGMKWEIEKEKELEARFSGSYYLRTNRTDLDGKELWSLYMMLGRVEDSFRALKSELGLRPVYHQKDFRMEAHLFISVLAYHLMTVIRRKLYRKGIGHSWNTIRDRMATHMRATASITNDRGERLHLRQTGDPESCHLEIYKALGIPPRALPTKRLKV